MSAAHLRPIRIEGFGEPTDAAPRASVVVVLHRPDDGVLDRVLAGLRVQTLDRFELIFVDNGGGLARDAILRRVEAPGVWIELARNVGPARARDLAAAHARSDLLVFLDDDAVPDAGFVDAHVRCRDDGAVAVRGRVVPFRSKLLNRFAVEYDLGPKGFPHPLDVEGNTSVDRAAYLAAGGFGPAGWGGEGLVLTAKLLSMAGADRIRYDPRPVVAHDYSAGPFDLLRVRAREVRAARIHAGRVEGSAADSRVLRAASSGRSGVTRALAGIDAVVDASLGFEERVRGRIGRLRPRSAVLMYHSVGEEGRWGAVSAGRFREDLERLVSEYDVVDVPEALAPWPSDRPLVAVTFDDALGNFGEHALPLLEEFGVPATLYVPVGLVDGGHREYLSRLDRSPTGDAAFNDPDPGGGTATLLTSAELRAIRDSGLVTLGNHTSTHPDLAVLDPAFLPAEIGQARRALQRDYSVPADQFAYPYGRHSPAAVDTVRDAHSIAVTTENRPVGWRDSSFLVPRLHGHMEWWHTLPGGGTHPG
jgi:peptidoglycan/xylan/chitin deacetylase (PgdA/CDA1 family)